MPDSRTPIRLLVCDLDDTLYSEREYIFSGFDAVAHTHRDLLGDAAETAERLRTVFLSGNRNRTFNQLLAELGLQEAPEVIAMLVRTFREHRPRIALFTDADACLSFWSPRVNTAVVSDGYLKVQENKVAALRLAGRVDQVVLTDRWGAEFWKPHPRAFEHVQAQFALQGPLCAYVADNPAKDFVAPNRLGWRTVRIRRTGAIYEHAAAPQAGSPAQEIRDLDELKILFSPA